MASGGRGGKGSALYTARSAAWSKVKFPLDFSNIALLSFPSWLIVKNTMLLITSESLTGGCHCRSTRYCSKLKYWGKGNSNTSIESEVPEGPPDSPAALGGVSVSGFGFSGTGFGFTAVFAGSGGFSLIRFVDGGAGE